MIGWSRCPEVESVPGRCSGAWVVKGTRVIVESCSRQCRRLHPDEIADQFAVAVEIVRRILRFAYQEQLAALYEARRTPLYPRDYELGGVILRHKLAALDQC